MKNIASKTIQTIVVFGAFVFAGAEAFASDDTTVSVGVNSDFEFEKISDMSATISVAHELFSVGNFGVGVEALVVDVTAEVSEKEINVEGWQAGVLANVGVRVSERFTVVAGVGVPVRDYDSVVQVGVDYKLSRFIVGYRAIHFRTETFGEFPISDLLLDGSTTHAIRVGWSF